MNVYKMKVHPAADIFPMLADDELDDLAADIKAHGLLHAIVVKDGVLIDGRNRLEACRRAGVEPQIEDLNGVDPLAYIMSANINRRNLTKGQRAMAVAKLYPEPAKGGRGNVNPIKNIEFSRQYVDHARTVLRCLPELADAVLAGTKPLHEAYAEAQKTKADLDSDVKRQARLRERAPDLADLVDDGRMKLVEAESAYATRQEFDRRQRQATLEVTNELERLLDMLAAGKRRANFVEHTEDKPRVRGLFKAWIKNLSETLEDLR